MKKCILGDSLNRKAFFPSILRRKECINSWKKEKGHGPFWVNTDWLMFSCLIPYVTWTWRTFSFTCISIFISSYSILLGHAFLSWFLKHGWIMVMVFVIRILGSWKSKKLTETEFQQFTNESWAGLTGRPILLAQHMQEVNSLDHGYI